VPALTSAELLEASPGEPSAVVRARVLAARERQRARGWLNSALPNHTLRGAGSLESDARSLIADAMDRGGMSARGVHRALRVARTITDLAGRERVPAEHLAEALQHRAYEARRFSAAG
jgi:magnesium chelatase family protein